MRIKKIEKLYLWSNAPSWRNEDRTVAALLEKSHVMVCLQSTLLFADDQILCGTAALHEASTISHIM
jgi:hypothetical protein